MGLLHSRPIQASMLKNAGLAYLNLVRSPRQNSEDKPPTPQDPLGAASLLPWEAQDVAATHRLLKTRDDECGALMVRGAENAQQNSKERAMMLTSTALATTADGSTSRAVGNWRNEASTRFMQLWKEFLDHEDASLDSQYGTIRDIYGQLVNRVGATRRKRATGRGG